MPFQPPPRTSSVLASVLAAAGLVLAVASCSHLAPIGPDAAATMPPPRHLGSPIVLEAMRSQPPRPAGGCPAGSVAFPAPLKKPQCRGGLRGNETASCLAGRDLVIKIKAAMGNFPER
jgi:hypothetical protein